MSLLPSVLAPPLATHTWLKQVCLLWGEEPGSSGPFLVVWPKLTVPHIYQRKLPQRRAATPLSDGGTTSGWTLAEGLRIGNSWSSPAIQKGIEHWFTPCEWWQSIHELWLPVPHLPAFQDSASPLDLWGSKQAVLYQTWHFPFHFTLPSQVQGYKCQNTKSYWGLAETWLIFFYAACSSQMQSNIFNYFCHYSYRCPCLMPLKSTTEHEDQG